LYADTILNVVLPDAIKGGAPFAIILNEANPMLLIVMLKRQHEIVSAYSTSQKMKMFGLFLALRLKMFQPSLKDQNDDMADLVRDYANTQLMTRHKLCDMNSNCSA
jgi:hypothetical protein